MKVFKKHRILIGTFLLTIIGFVAVGFFLFELSKSRTFQVFGDFIPRVETNEKVVALTFDDGPTERTKDVLQTLAEKNVKGTFFLIGEEIEKSPEIGQEIVRQGHDVGNHSYSHPRFYFKSQDFIDREVSKTSELIRKLGYDKEITFRPPNGKRLFGLTWYLQQNNIKTILWDVEPDTYLDLTLDDQSQVDFMVQYTVNHVNPGSIILLHPNCIEQCAIDRESLPKIIDELTLLGYRFVTISELLKYRK